MVEQYQKQEMARRLRVRLASGSSFTSPLTQIMMALQRADV